MFFHSSWQNYSDFTSICTSRSFPNSWFITGFVTRITQRMPLVEQELFTLSEYLSSLPVFSWVRVTRSLVLCVCFVDRCLSFFSFFLAIVLSVLRFTDSDYPFGIFKLFLIPLFILVTHFVFTSDLLTKIPAFLSILRCNFLRHIYIPPQTIWFRLVFLLFTRWKLFGGFCLLYLYFAFFVDKTASGNNIL